MLSRAGHLVETKLDVHRLRRLDAAAQQSDKAVLFLDRLKQIAQLLLIRETDRGGHLRGAFDVNSALGAVAQTRGIAQAADEGRRAWLRASIQRNDGLDAWRCGRDPPGEMYARDEST